MSVKYFKQNRMKIIKDNSKVGIKYPFETQCNNCHSILEVESKDDIIDISTKDINCEDVVIEFKTVCPICKYKILHNQFIDKRIN